MSHLSKHLLTAVKPNNFVLTGTCTNKDLGCWLDSATRTITGGWEAVTTVDACATKAKAFGATVFAVQNGNACFAASKNAQNSYRFLGPSDKCGANGLGGPYANHVYEIVCGKLLDEISEDKKEV